VRDHTKKPNQEAIPNPSFFKLTSMVTFTSEASRSRSKKVCVIGAGPAGLVSARELRKEGHKVVVLEQNEDVGGQWFYQPNVEEEDPLGRSSGSINGELKVHSSIYSSLRLTSPREIMGYSDFPFLAKKGRDMRRFPGHKELWLYLKDFSEAFGLREMIRFNVRVEFVGEKEEEDDVKKWIVRSREKFSGKVMEEIFDAVVVATGHYSHPRLPSIKGILLFILFSHLIMLCVSMVIDLFFHVSLMVIGMDSWKRKQIHSHVYRVPDPFRNEVIETFISLILVMIMMVMVMMTVMVMMMVIGGGGGWELNEWTRHINGACGSGKGSSFKCQDT